MKSIQISISCVVYYQGLISIELRYIRKKSGMKYVA
jgi:hypothetical protein